MEIKGKILVIGQREAKTSKAGKEYFMQNMVIETIEQYPKKVALEIGKIKEENLKYLKVGGVVTASINIESREYQGKYYTTVSAWKCMNEAGINKDNPIQGQEKVINTPYTYEPTGADKEDDLPFN